MSNETVTDFKWQTEQFADIRILRYQINGFEKLSLNQKIFTWHLYQAALAGRDLIYDQNYKYNLIIRNSLEAVYQHYEGKKNDENWAHFVTYLKRIWFSNGIHHHYSMDKFFPSCTENWLKSALNSLDESQLPIPVYQHKNDFVDWLTDIIYNPEIAPKRLNQDEGADHVAQSACNFYDGLNQQEAEDFYAKKKQPDENEPLWHGLNTRLVKRNGEIKEEVYKSDGCYGKAIRKIVVFLEKAKDFAENETQQAILEKLIQFYETGDLKTFNEYNKLWVQDTDSVIDLVHGFIEVYGDPLGRHATFESVLSLRDEEATQRFGKISELAPWFEANSPIDEAHKRKEPKGVSYKVIQVIVESGDCSPSSPIGINLPNADWIRERYGSKSVSLGNIEDAYENASHSTGSIEEFYLPEQQQRIKTFGALASKIHTGLHEVIGHGSGQLIPGVPSPKESLKSYANTLEEARADLVALYYMLDEKLIEEGFMESLETGKAEYDSFFLNGLMRQLVRLEPGQQLEESHMRNRQLIAKWVFEKAAPERIIEMLVINNKTYIRINDYEKTRILVGELLREVQRIKSEGDYQAAKALVEGYGVKVDQQLHQEVLERWKKLGIAPFAGFINPQLEKVCDNGRIGDIRIIYPEDFAAQMLYYSSHFAFLPALND
jgi:dipeptidyl-peptidase-3